MSLTEKVTNEWKQSLRDRNEVAKIVLSTLRSAFKNAEIEKKSELTDEEALKVVQKEVKKRKDSIAAYLAVDRQEAIDKEQAELDVLSNYIPSMLTEEEIQNIINNEINTIKSIRSVTMKDMGSLVKSVISQSKGAADGKLVSGLVKQSIENSLK